MDAFKLKEPLPKNAVRRGYAIARYRGSLVSLLARTIICGGLPQILLTFGAGLGDQLLCTSVLREFRRRNRRGLWIMSDSAELYQHNADIDAVVPVDKNIVAFVRALKRPVITPAYAHHIPTEDRDIPPPRHIIACMCQAAGLSGPITIRPYVTLLDREQQAGQVAPRQIAIQSTGLGAKYPMRNKEWYAERFQAVVRALGEEYTFVQLGVASDPLLEGAIDLRGRTTPRQSAAILSQSLTFIGQVGFLMHLARAVECRSVIVYGGREHPSQSGYTCNENLFSTVPCAPCWRWNTCEFDRMCMRMITTDQVVEAIERQIERAKLPLEVDRDTLP